MYNTNSEVSYKDSKNPNQLQRQFVPREGGGGDTVRKEENGSVMTIFEKILSAAFPICPSG